MDYQRIVLCGNAAGDAQAHTSKDGAVSYTRFSVAVSRGKGKETVFFPVTAFGRTGQAVARYVSKGRQVLVEGRVETGEQGRFNVVASRVIFGLASVHRGAASPPKPAEALPAGPVVDEPAAA